MTTRLTTKRWNCIHIQPQDTFIWTTLKNLFWRKSNTNCYFRNPRLINLTRLVSFISSLSPIRRHLPIWDILCAIERPRKRERECLLLVVVVIVAVTTSNYSLKFSFSIFDHLLIVLLLLIFVTYNYRRIHHLHNMTVICPQSIAARQSINQSIDRSIDRLADQSSYVLCVLMPRVINESLITAELHAMTTNSKISKKF